VQCETTIDILEGGKNGISTYQFFGLCLYIFIFMYYIALYVSTHIEFDCLHESFQHDAALSVIENAKYIFILFLSLEKIY
jgi:hypothetical protein